MNALVYLPLLVPVLAAAAARPLAARLEPRLATWLLTATTVALAGASAVEAARDLHALLEFAQAAR